MSSFVIQSKCIDYMKIILSLSVTWVWIGYSINCSWCGELIFWSKVYYEMKFKST